MRSARGKHLRGRYNAAAVWPGASRHARPGITALYFTITSAMWPTGYWRHGAGGGALMLRLKHLLSAAKTGASPTLSPVVE